MVLWPLRSREASGKGRPSARCPEGGQKGAVHASQQEALEVDVKHPPLQVALGNWREAWAAFAGHGSWSWEEVPTQRAGEGPLGP